MKSIEEQTREAAENHCDRFDDLSQEERKSCIGDFESGAGWERSRNKWISVKDELPVESQIVLAFGDGKIPSWCIYEQNRFMRYIDMTPEVRCYDIEYTEISHWQPLPAIPEPPKQKDKI